LSFLGLNILTEQRSSGDPMAKMKEKNEKHEEHLLKKLHKAGASKAHHLKEMTKALVGGVTTGHKELGKHMMALPGKAKALVREKMHEKNGMMTPRGRVRSEKMESMHERHGTMTPRGKIGIVSKKMEPKKKHHRRYDED